MEVVKMLYKFENNQLEMIPFFDCQKAGLLEKDLENLFAQNMEKIYEDCGLLPIFQERVFQPEADILAIDKDGNLIIFEFKRSFVDSNTSLQIMRYAQKYGRYNYARLNDLYEKYSAKSQGVNSDKSINELKKAHREAFDLDKPLPDECFNQHQKLYIIGNSSDTELRDVIDYWKSTGLDIDFMPFRFYKINNEIYFEFFAKPYDYHANPSDNVGIVFDTNKTWDEDAIWDMFANNKVSAYYGKASEVNRFRKKDYVFYYHVGYGIVGAGIITSNEAHEIRDNNNELAELYHDVNLITPKITNESEIRAISAKELKSLLGHGLFFARTAKVPYLSLDESEIIIDRLQKKYN